MMSDIPFSIELMLAGLAGLALGLFFYGGLWLTVRALPTSHSPALLMLGSFIIRMTVVVMGIYFIMGDRWERVLACLVGILLARTILVIVCKPVNNQGNPKGATHHADKP